MSLLIRFILVSFTGSAYSALSTRIVGGETTTIEQYSSIVQVDYFSTRQQIWDQSCGANILNTRYILSAAHCYHGPHYQPELRRIRAGATYRNIGGVVIYVARAFNHPQYNETTIDSDISVVQLQSSLVYSDVIRPVTIIAPGFTFPDNLPVVYAGWGVTETNRPSEVLRHVSVYTVNQDVCNEKYSIIYQNITSNMICTATPGGGKGSCQQDSGGPLYYGNILVGIVSWDIGCGGEYPGVSAAVSPFTDWIIATAV